MTLPAPTLTPAAAPRRRGRLVTLGLAALPPVALVAALAASTHSAAANPPGPHDPVGKLEHVSANTDGTVTLAGWAADPDTTAKVTVLALVDGRIVARVPTSIARPVITRKHHSGATPGFAFNVAVPTSGVHVLCAAARDIGLGSPTVLGCVATPLGTKLNSGQTSARSPHGVVSVAQASSTAVTVAGWSADPDFRRAHLVAVLYLDGRSAQTVTTAVATPAQRAAGSGPYGAFRFSVPVNTGSHNACVWLVNQGLGANASLGCRPLDTRGAPGTAPVTTPATNTKALKEAKKHLGGIYVWGAEGPKTFDCSGLVMYSYRKAGYSTPRIAQDQFTAARVIPASRAVPGDLVFYHDSVGAVYHVGLYVAPLETVAAIDEAEGIAHQHIWDPSSATYGSFTHT